MSRTPAFDYEIINAGTYRQPQIARVFFDDGTTREFKFGPHVSRRQIVEMLPRIVMDTADNRRKRRNAV